MRLLIGMSYNIDKLKKMGYTIGSRVNNSFEVLVVWNKNYDYEVSHLLNSNKYVIECEINKNKGEGMEYNEIKIKVPKVGKTLSFTSKVIASSVAKAIGVGLAVVAEKLINFSGEKKGENDESREND